MRSVSLIIAAYNAESTIGRAIASALAEAETGAVIVVDDASNDATVANARAADDGTGRLQILRQPANAGPAAARNRALAIIDLPWVGILDADDYFLPGRLAVLLAAASDDTVMVADDMWQVDEAELDDAPDAKDQRLLQPPLQEPRLIGFREFVLANVTGHKRRRAELGFIKPLIRRSFLEEHNLRYREQMRLGEDFELYARALALGAQLLLVPAAGYVSVVRATSLSSRHTEVDLESLRDCAVALGKDYALAKGDRAALARHRASIDCRLQWRLLIRAVKQRQPGAALACFRRPWPVAPYLLGQLITQLWRRTAGRMVIKP
jgi:succinoglycan biosynthesis protein ExoU